MERENFIWLAVIIVIALILFYWLYYVYTKEKYAPYASILAPQIVNSRPAFDDPNQYGDILDPYYTAKNKTDRQFFNQINALTATPLSNSREHYVPCRAKG